MIGNDVVPKDERVQLPGATLTVHSTSKSIHLISIQYQGPSHRGTPFHPTPLTAYVAATHHSPCSICEKTSATSIHDTQILAGG